MNRKMRFIPADKAYNTIGVKLFPFVNHIAYNFFPEISVIRVKRIREHKQIGIVFNCYFGNPYISYYLQILQLFRTDDFSVIIASDQCAAVSL